MVGDRAALEHPGAHLAPVTGEDLEPHQPVVQEQRVARGDVAGERRVGGGGAVRVPDARLGGDRELRPGLERGGPAGEHAETDLGALQVGQHPDGAQRRV